jgi:hypothetical protein
MIHIIPARSAQNHRKGRLLGSGEGFYGPEARKKPSLFGVQKPVGFDSLRT